MALFYKLAAVALSLTLAAATPIQAQETEYVLATASTGGTYYPVGVALATLMKVKLQPDSGISMSALPSAGSGENINLLRNGVAQFGILQGLYGINLASGNGPLTEAGPQDNLRAVSVMWQNVEHFVIASDAVTTGTMADFVALKGQSVALGAPNSGTLESNRVLLAGLGLNLDSDFKLMSEGYGPAADALQAGEIAGISMPGGDPVGALSHLLSAAGHAVTLLSFTPDEIAAADGGRDLWSAYTIPANTYAGQSEDIATIAQPNFLAVNADVSEDDVYLITKTIYENLPFLQAIHPTMQSITLDTAIVGLPIPLHPGALRYYQEVGIEVPANLIAQ